MSHREPITRKLALTQLAPFAHGARAALSQAGVADLEHVRVFQTHVTARCCLCDARPSSEVLGALLTGAELEAGRPAEELARLRQEFCLRAGCESRFYELTFTPLPAVNWAAIGMDAQLKVPGPSVALAVSGAVVRTTAQTIRAQLTWKLAAAVALLLALVLWRQWWTGGSIPLLREARPFSSEVSTPEPLSADDGDAK